MSGYPQDRSFSDRYIDAIKLIVGPRLLQVASFEQDVSEATDLIMLQARPLDIACRVRRPGFAALYPDEFTLRSRRPSGGATELDKIIDGHGDWLFYGHAIENTGNGIIDPWHLIDLAAFRSHLIRGGGLSGRNEKRNADGTGFSVFSLKDFPSTILIDKGV